MMLRRCASAAGKRRLASALSHDPLYDRLMHVTKIRREEVSALKRDHSDKKIQDVKVNNLLGGMRGITGILCDTSLVDPDKGISFHEKSIKELLQSLPKSFGNQVSPEGLFYLMLTREIPDSNTIKHLSENITSRAKLPDYTKRILDNLKHLHPMVQMSAAVASLSDKSIFKKSFGSMPKRELWTSIYEDSLNLIGMTTSICSHIHNNLASNTEDSNNKNISNKDVSGHFFSNLNFNQPKNHSQDVVEDYLRLFLTLHSDHEGGNVSSHSCLLVGSAMSDPYLSFSAALNGLAGPLHGRANQEVLDFIYQIIDENPDPTDLFVEEFIQRCLEKGKVIPGFGHAVLRITDTRCTAQLEFVRDHLSDSSKYSGKELIVAQKLIKIAPEVMKKHEKIKNPNPNVDAISGSILHELGFTDPSFYTVLFGLSRSFGCMANMIINHQIGYPIERPKSITVSGLKKLIGE